jgi:hypothetical protein
MRINERGGKRKRDAIQFLILEVFKHNFLFPTFVDKTLNLVSLNKNALKLVVIYKRAKQKTVQWFF